MRPFYINLRVLPVSLFFYLAATVASITICEVNEWDHYKLGVVMLTGLLSHLLLSIYDYTNGFKRGLSVGAEEDGIGDDPIGAIAGLAAPSRRGGAIMQSIVIALCRANGGEIRVDKMEAVTALLGGAGIKGVQTTTTDNHVVVRLLHDTMPCEVEDDPSKPPF